MAEVIKGGRHFYQELKTDKSKAKGKWKTFMRRNDQKSVLRLTQSPPNEVKPHDRLLLIERISEGLGEIMLLYKAELDSDAQIRAFEFLRDTIDQGIRAIEPPTGSVPTVAFTDLFEGVITSLDEKSIRVEFKVGDDLENQQFDRNRIKTAQQVYQGQAVRARCHLELIPPREPMSDDEIEKWKRQYRDVRGYLKKAKRGRNLLEEYDE